MALKSSSHTLGSCWPSNLSKLLLISRPVGMTQVRMKWLKHSAPHRSSSAVMIGLFPPVPRRARAAVDSLLSEVVSKLAVDGLNAGRPWRFFGCGDLVMLLPSCESGSSLGRWICSVECSFSAQYADSGQSGFAELCHMTAIVGCVCHDVCLGGHQCSFSSFGQHIDVCESRVQVSSHVHVFRVRARVANVAY